MAELDEACATTPRRIRQLTSGQAQKKMAPNSELIGASTRCYDIGIAIVGELHEDRATVFRPKKNGPNRVTAGPV